MIYTYFHIKWKWSCHNCACLFTLLWHTQQYLFSTLSPLPVYVWGCVHVVVVWSQHHWQAWSPHPPGTQTLCCHSSLLPSYEAGSTGRCSKKDAKLGLSIVVISFLPADRQRVEVLSEDLKKFNWFQHYEQKLCYE